MFDRPTLLILGAGASQPYGYPTGYELKSRILQLSKVCSGIDRVRNVSFGEGPDIQTNVLDLARNYINAMSNDPVGKSTIGDFNHHKEFYEVFSQDSPAGSIDSFLYNHDRFSEVGRFYVLYALLLARYRHELSRVSGDRTQLTTRIGVEGKGAWYSELVRILRHQCDTPEALERNNLRVLTFNYDRSLELFLEDKLSRTDRHAGANWEQVIDIHHLYGEMPVDNAVQGRVDTVSLCSIAWNHREGIRLIGDRSQKDEIEICRHFEWAESVSLIGFGFDTDNLRLLGLPETLAGKDFRYHNFQPESANFERNENVIRQWRKPLEFEVQRENQSGMPMGDETRSLLRTLSEAERFQRNLKESVFTGLLGAF